MESLLHQLREVVHHHMDEVPRDFHTELLRFAWQIHCKMTRGSSSVNELFKAYEQLRKQRSILSQEQTQDGHTFCCRSCGKVKTYKRRIIGDQCISCTRDINLGDY